MDACSDQDTSPMLGKSKNSINEDLCAYVLSVLGTELIMYFIMIFVYKDNDVMNNITVILMITELVSSLGYQLFYLYINYVLGRREPMSFYLIVNLMSVIIVLSMLTTLSPIVMYRPYIPWQLVIILVTKLLELMCFILSLVKNNSVNDVVKVCYVC